MRRRLSLPLSLPVPFQIPIATAVDRRDLMDILAVVDLVPELAKPDIGYAATVQLADVLVAAEPTAPMLPADVEIAVSSGAGIAAFEQLVNPPRRARRVSLLTWNVLAWTAMDRAVISPERHGPWIAYGVQVGYFLGRRGRGSVVDVRMGLEQWFADRMTITHTVTCDGRLVADLGIGRDGRIAALDYSALRPIGLERMHDTAMLETAWDDLAQSHGLGRPFDTPASHALFPFVWTPALG